MTELLGKWVDDMKIAFTEDELKSIVREFVRVAYGLDETDLESVFFFDTNLVGIKLDGAQVKIKSKAARPASWADFTYRQTTKPDG